MTDPPIVGDVGVLVGRRFGVPVLVISQDVFPEIATELGRLRNPAVVGVLRTLVGGYLRRADRIVAIGETMRLRLEPKGAAPDRLRVIPNWVDTSEITPQPRDNTWSQAHGLEGKFVVMHSGNVGHAQDLDSLVRVGDVPARPRRPADRHRGIRRAPQRDGRARGAPRGDGCRPLSAVPEARAAPALALERRPARRRAREGPGRLRRAEPALRDPRRRPPGDRSRRRGQRDREARLRGRLRRRHPARASGASSRARSVQPATARTTSRRWDGEVASTSSARPTAPWR